jgi:tRNA/tmRNA/rRNA uracil-C5-methylase (TrmA/RlmC/RlmD family)
MPGVVPSAQGRSRQGTRTRPGAVGGAAARPATTAPRDSGPYLVGQEIEVTVGDAAQGGWCVARPDGLPVIFVRHALPGERVLARVTEVTAKFARADAVEIRQASQDRVPPPCPAAHPGGCGGCDWQHASLPAQRALKASVIAQQLKRLAGIDRTVTVEPLPGDAEITASGGTLDDRTLDDRTLDDRTLDDRTLDDGTPGRRASAAGTPDHRTPGDRRPGLGWRTRVQFAVDREGVAGLRAHRSHEVIDIGDCLIAHDVIRELDIPGHDWSGAATVEAVAGSADVPDNVAVTVIDGGAPPKARKNRNQRGTGRLPGHKRTLVEGRPYLAERAAGRIWQVGTDGFWQVHPAAADALCAAVVAGLRPEAGDTVLDLYCGAGLFAGAVAPLVGAGGAVTGIELDAAAIRNAKQNLADYPWAQFRKADAATAAQDGDLPDTRLVIADPPRAGLAREVIGYLTGEGQAERFAYVSCDPATLARDLGLLLAGGWRLGELRAFDAFPMTQHVECVAVLSRDR